jgi:hypothetical protein
MKKTLTGGETLGLGAFSSTGGTKEQEALLHGRGFMTVGDADQRATQGPPGWTRIGGEGRGGSQVSASDGIRG